ncbi:GH25 family lysozyme [Pseudoalteromonas xiamenensis]
MRIGSTRRFIIYLALLTCALVGLWYGIGHLHQPTTNRSDAQAPIYYGIDVSHYQGDLIVDLPKHTGLHFIIAKATNGAKGVDAKFAENWSAIKAHGRIRGAYHFYIAGESPQAQAMHFINTVGQWTDSDITPIVDVEQYSVSHDKSVSQLHEDLLSFLDYVESNTGRLPMIYSNTKFAQMWLNNSEFGRYPLWLADYTKAKKPVVPEVWQHQGLFIWQRSDTYKLESTEVDYDVFRGELSQLSGFNHKLRQQ